MRIIGEPRISNDFIIAEIEIDEMDLKTGLFNPRIILCNYTKSKGKFIFRGIHKLSIDLENFINSEIPKLKAIRLRTNFM
ncbi:hypothetical protein ACFWMP_13000 [Paenibacillus sp. NPDC058367]|uniref:hypothetical protein n=1 Tax=Paenibacillus sp. NPDC058367 TaxID=3346460 RepID=UPI00365BBC39